MSSNCDRNSTGGLEVLALVLFAVAIRTLLVLQMQWGRFLGFARPSLARSCVLLVLTCPFGILVHEWGHCLAGAISGQRCRRVVVGPVEFARGPRGWSMRWITLHGAGLVDLVPSTFVQFRLRRSISIAGGPLASLVAGLAFTSMAFRAAAPSLYWAWSFCAQWALVGLLGVVPMRRGAARSDGYRLWELIRGGAAADAIERDLLTPSSHATALRFRDWPQGLLRRLADTPADAPARRYGAYLAYIHFLDRGEVAEAGRYLDRLMAEWKPGDPPEYALEAAYFLAHHGHDPLAARSWLDRETRDAEPWVRLRAEAAIESAASPEKARVLIDKALAALQAASACGAHQYEIDRVQAILALTARSRPGA